MGSEKKVKDLSLAFNNRWVLLTCGQLLWGQTAGAAAAAALESTAHPLFLPASPAYHPTNCSIFKKAQVSSLLSKWRHGGRDWGRVALQRRSECCPPGRSALSAPALLRGPPDPHPPAARKQEAFERCEGINQQSDEMRDQAAGDHAAKKKELGARRQALGRKVAASASAMAE